MGLPLHQLHVLVIEDEVLNATLVVAMLKIQGIMKTHICTSGREIAEVIADMERVDLVLLDLQLPGESGFDLIARLRNFPKCFHTPIIAVSAQVMPDAVLRAEQAGFDGFLGKPLNFDRFPTNIKRITSGEKVWEPR